MLVVIEVVEEVLWGVVCVWGMGCVRVVGVRVVGIWRGQEIRVVVVVVTAADVLSVVVVGAVVVRTGYEYLFVSLVIVGCGMEGVEIAVVGVGAVVASALWLSGLAVRLLLLRIESWLNCSVLVGL